MKKEKFLDNALQLMMVILGVYFGMLASNWNTDRKLKEARKDILIGLKTEIEDNLGYLESRKNNDLIPFFNALDSLTKKLETQQPLLDEPFKDRPFGERVPRFPGLGRPTLGDAMFEATKYSNMLSNFNLDLIKQITKTYNLQYNIQETRRLLDHNMQMIGAEYKYRDALTLMWDIMQNYFGAQYNLIDEYKKTIDLIDVSIG